MLDVVEAERLIAERLPRWPGESVPLAEAAGRILAEDVLAEREQPPFDRVTMDGIALKMTAFAPGVSFRIQATQAAGDPPATLEAGATCIEIMTGAVLPAGADCVVPVEQVEIETGRARLRPGCEPEPWRFVHRRGSDHRAGVRVLARGQRIRAPEMAVLAGNGRTRVQVAARPQIAVISTGDELVEPGRPIAPHQIRSCNGPAIVAALALRGLTAVVEERLPDDAQILRARLARHLAERDLLVLTGGVSMGKFDYLPGVLEALGVQLVFHKVAQRPGKPMWFGMAPGPRPDAVPIFALPGNPVSTLVCLHRYVLPALGRAAGLAAEPGEQARLAATVASAAPLTLFLPVRLERESGEVRARPVLINTSGDFTSLAGTDGFIELPATAERFAAGWIAPLYRW